MAPGFFLPFGIGQQYEKVDQVKAVTDFSPCYQQAVGQDTGKNAFLQGKADQYGRDRQPVETGVPIYFRYFGSAEVKGQEQCDGADFQQASLQTADIPVFQPFIQTEQQHADEEIGQTGNGIDIPVSFDIVFRREIHTGDNQRCREAENAQQPSPIPGQRNEEGETDIEKLFAAQAPRGTVEREEITGFGDVGVRQRQGGQKMPEPVQSTRRDDAVKGQAIRQLIETEKVPVGDACATFDVPRCTYYRYLKALIE